MSCLLVIKGPNLGIRYELGERTRIGRLGENEIQVSDANVSRVHAEIIKDRMAFTIVDRGSKNGLLVNGEEVRDKVLLRNDEVQIGNTIFLFNSDLNIRNARFSNNSVYLYPADDDTLHDARRRSGLEKLTGRERESIEFVLRFADLFAAPPAPLSETAERLVNQILTLFTADAAVLMLKEASSDELKPVIALPAGRSIGINRAVIASVAEEKRALLSSAPAFLPPSRSEDDEMLQVAGRVVDMQTVGDDLKTLSDIPPPRQAPEAKIESQSGNISTLCAPIYNEDELMGVIVVEKSEPDFYTLRDLGLLQAVAKLTAGTIESARLADRIAHRQVLVMGDYRNGNEVDLVQTRSLRMQEIYNAARRTAESDVTVLVTGETGTGKEMLASHIHTSSKRASGPFLAVNCGAIPANLFESELFGYEKGAFTGAVRTTAGKVEAAEGGTLFLDEIGELDIALQPKLLRFLQDHAFYRVGGTRAIDANVRIIAATNQDLAGAVRSGVFREDLWYRLNVVPFHLPPLRERREDIGQLVDYMVVKFATRLNRRVLGANDSALALLQKYDWPGNIRELENAIERAVLLAEGKILTAADFTHIDEARRRAQAQNDLERKRETQPLTEVERQHIIVALKKFNYNQARAAEALGLHRNTLRNKIVEYGIDVGRKAAGETQAN